MALELKLVEQAAEQQAAGLNPCTVCTAPHLPLDHTQQNRLQSAAPPGIDPTEVQHAGEEDTAEPLTNQ